MNDFVERHFRELALFALILLLMLAHAAMMHWNRPVDMVHWIETLISSAFAALIAILANNNPKSS